MTWRTEIRSKGMALVQVRRLRVLEEKGSKLKDLVAVLSVVEQILW